MTRWPSFGRAAKAPVRPVPEPNRFLTAKQAATVCSCSRRTIARMIADGTLPSVHLRPGCKKSLRIRTADLDRLAPAGSRLHTGGRKMNTEPRSREGTGVGAVRSGISSDMLARAGVRHVDAAEAEELCGLAAPGLWIPYRTPTGGPILDTRRPVPGTAPVWPPAAGHAARWNEILLVAGGVVPMCTFRRA